MIDEATLEETLSQPLALDSLWSPWLHREASGLTSQKMRSMLEEERQGNQRFCGTSPFPTFHSLVETGWNYVRSRELGGFPWRIIVGSIFFSNKPSIFCEFASQMDFFMDRSTARIRAVGGGEKG